MTRSNARLGISWGSIDEAMKEADVVKRWHRTDGLLSLVLEDTTRCTILKLLDINRGGRFGNR